MFGDESERVQHVGEEATEELGDTAERSSAEDVVRDQPVDALLTIVRAQNRKASTPLY